MVKSWLNTQTGRPSTVPYPVTTPSPYGRLDAMSKSVARCRASSSNSVNEPGSSSPSIRSRAVILPRACCRSTARSDPACTASCLRFSRSAILPAVVCGAGGSASSAGERASVAMPHRLAWPAACLWRVAGGLACGAPLVSRTAWCSGQQGKLALAPSPAMSLARALPVGSSAGV